MKMLMKIALPLGLGLSLAVLPVQGIAALQQGTKAPDFTPGCTVEAHLFAEANGQFNQLGARVIGVTAGNIHRVAEFSRSECRDKFAVAADPGAKIAAQYDATMQAPDGTKLSSRTSYVIAPNGTILLSYTDSKPQAHIEKTMAAVRAWNAKRH